MDCSDEEVSRGTSINEYMNAELMYIDFRMYYGLYNIARTLELLSQDYDMRVLSTVEPNSNNQSFASLNNDIHPLMVRSRILLDGQGPLLYGVHQKLSSSHCPSVNG